MLRIRTMIGVARRQKKWSLRQLAQKLGYAHGYIHDLEEGNRNPSAYAALQLGQVLGLNLDVVGKAWLDDHLDELQKELDHARREVSS